MSYKITITNPGNHICNPLLTLDGRQYATREDACEAINEALYDVIDSEPGCEMVAKPNLPDWVVCDDESWSNNAMIFRGDAIPTQRQFGIDAGFDDADKLPDAPLPVTDLIDYVTGCEGEVGGHLICDGTDAEVAVRDAIALYNYPETCHNYIIDHGYATEDGVTATVEEVTEELGHLWHCTREGITGDVMDNGPAYTREEAAGFTGIELGADDECVHLREETGADDVTSDVDFVAVDGDGNVLGYYRFKPVRIED